MANEEGAVAEAEFTPKPLDSLFGSEEFPPEVPAEPTAEESNQDAESDQGEPEKPEESTEAETGEEVDGSPPPDEDKDEKTVPLAALRGERDRRQAVEAELEALKADKTPDATTEVAPKQELPSIYDGEGAFQESLTGLIKNTVRQEAFNERLKTSQIKAVAEFGEEKVQAALNRMTPEMAKTPAYVERFRSSLEPFMEIVAMSDDLDKAEKLTDPEYVSKWEAEKEKEIEARIRSELEGKAAEENALDDAIPDSLSGSGSAGNLQTGVPYSGPKPLTEIL